MNSFLQYVLVSTLACAAIFWVSRAFVPWLLKRRGVHYERKTKFGPALVFETSDASGTPVRLLNVGGAFQSAAYVDDELRDELVCVYHRIFAQVVWDNFGHGWPLEVLVLGGGGYSFPRWAAAKLPEAQVTAVEIDPAITGIARRHFFLSDAEAAADGRLSCVNDDGWAYLRASGLGSWRIIVNDAFSRNKPLGPMKTDEGAHIIHEHLSDDGIYLANVISPLEGRGSNVLHETVEIFKQVFPYVYLVPERPETPTKRACNVLIASNRMLSVVSN